MPWVYARVHAPFPSAEHLSVLASEHFLSGQYSRALDLAEQAVDDLGTIENLDAERAAKLIMAARAHWFDQEKQA